MDTYRYLFYINSLITCILLTIGLSMSWSVYDNGHVRTRMDIYGISVCKANVTICITTNGSTDLSRSCRNLEMLYIFGAGIMIVLNMVGCMGVWAGAWDTLSLRFLELSWLSIGFLLGSYMSVDPCGRDWNIPLKMTRMYILLVTWTCILVCELGVYTIHRIWVHCNKVETLPLNV